MIQTSYKASVFILLILLLAFSSSHAQQTNTFSYMTWDDQSEWKAAVVKLFSPGDPVPQIRFQHSKVTAQGTEQTHYDDYINYISDAGDKWQATIQYNPDAGTFYFTHCKGGGDECHDDVVMNYRHVSGENRQLTIDNSSPQRFQSRTKQISLHTKFLNRWDGNTADSKVYKDVVYISWRGNEKCGCTGKGGGVKHYLYNTTAEKYKVTVQSIAYAKPSRIGTHDYIIKPGEETFLGCSQTQSQGCVSVDFAIIGQLKLQ